MSHGAVSFLEGAWKGWIFLGLRRCGGWRREVRGRVGAVREARGGPLGCALSGERARADSRANGADSTRRTGASREGSAGVKPFHAVVGGPLAGICRKHPIESRSLGRATVAC